MKRRPRKLVSGSRRPVGAGWGFKAGARRNSIKRTRSGGKMRKIFSRIKRSGKAKRYVSRYK